MGVKMKKIIHLVSLFPLSAFGHFYGGANLGWNSSDTTLKTNNGGIQESSQRLSGSGAVPGIHAGYDFDLDELLFIGAELNAGHITGTVTQKNGDTSNNDSPESRISNKGYASFSGKVGFKFVGVRLYGQVGYVVARQRFRQSFDHPFLREPIVVKKNYTRNGVSVGLGMSSEISKYMRVGLVFSHTFYDSKKFFIEPRNYKVTPGDHMALFQVSYIFKPEGAK